MPTWAYDESRRPGSYSYDTSDDGESILWENENDSSSDDQDIEVKPEWKELKTVLPDGSTTELLTITSAEYEPGEPGKERVVLVCPSGPHGRDKSPKVHMRWL